ncbi:MAG: hypothetical protein PHU99_07075 [Candidatus Cloacimonetes bacterium]|jgi:hypothetical protein|nr:hypothetical protein [Candidatus Cloacimonadota bacterium]MDD3097460.1 hypothetical protein [Candidatus Cloacimonadota bacterium]MDD4034643.1 hypothetical protein [Candidatus Cloacimonadota bacterium]MDD4667325.1 hypothetical protein [Candidatus Cloacimonadota bacterium]MDY0337820.1 hypothetical protein [Candidatus Cloacimonadaceae bacterium]
MKNILILGLVAVSIVLASCAGGFGLSEEQKLLRELKKWESFSGSGIIELSLMGFSLRKPFNLDKSLQQIRLDVIEGGVFGAGASPLLSVYLGDYLALNAPVMPALEMLNLKDKIPKSALAIFASSEYLMENYGAEIIANKAIVRDDFSVNFKKNYQLESVVDKDSGTRIDARYTGNGRLDTIEITSNKPVSARLIFDKVDYIQPSIIPIPKKEASQQDLMDLFQGGGVMDMFQQLLNGN